MKTLHNAIFFGAMIIVCTGLASCGRQRILQTDFGSEIYKPWETPALELPGEPEGDRMSYDAESGSRIAIRSERGEKSLEYFWSAAAHSDPNYARSWLNFEGIESRMTGKIWFVWIGKVENMAYGSTNAKILISLSGGSGTDLERISILRNGRVERTGNQQLLGQIDLEKDHMFVLTADLDRNRYDIAILDAGGNNNPTQTIENVRGAGSGSFPNPARPTVSFNFEREANLSRRYLIKWVHISRNEPEAEMRAFVARRLSP